LTNPSYGVSSAARAAEWGRNHGLGGVITWAENEWYKLNPPPTGGKPPAHTFNAKAHAGTGVTATCPNALAIPPRMVSAATPPIAGEGVWAPVGRLSAGCSALYETFVRPDAIHTSYVAGVVWMDPMLVSATLYSGSQIPGGGPYANSAPIKSTEAMTLISAFNAGFRMQDAQGGYYTDQKMVIPLVPGKASAVIYKNGTMDIGAWDTDVQMNKNVVSVRQNLDLIVNDAKPVPGLLANDHSQWGVTVGGAAYVWRSGMGITKNGAIVYVAGPSLSINVLADLLIRAGAVRGMEMDINADWVQYSTYSPPVGQPASPSNGVPLMASMAAGSQGPSRYFQTWWVRDFYTMSARYGATAKMPSTPTLVLPTVTTTTAPKKK
jgi:hypothetical protein